MHIHARVVHYFDSIRRAGSIRGAARQLHVTASAVNRQLLLLEQELGAPLFERLPGGLRLTSAGEAFARHVTQVLQDEQRLVAELDALRGLRRGEASLQVAAGLTSSMVPRLLMQMRARYPQVALQVEVATAQQSSEALLLGEVDVAVGFLSRAAGLRQCAVERFDFGVVMAADHPLANRGALTFAECAAYPLILPTPQVVGTWLALEPLLLALHEPPQVALRVGSTSLMQEMAARGLGLAFQNRLGLEEDLASGRVRHLPLQTPGELYAEMGVYVRADRALPPAVDALVRIAADELSHQAAL